MGLARHFGLTYDTSSQAGFFRKGSTFKDSTVETNHVKGTIALHSVEFFDSDYHAGFSSTYTKRRTVFIIDGQRKELHGIFWGFCSVHKIRKILSNLNQAL